MSLQSCLVNTRRQEVLVTPTVAYTAEKSLSILKHNQKLSGFVGSQQKKIPKAIFFKRNCSVLWKIFVFPSESWNRWLTKLSCLFLRDDAADSSCLTHPGYNKQHKTTTLPWTTDITSRAYAISSPFVVLQSVWYILWKT